MKPTVINHELWSVCRLSLGTEDKPAKDPLLPVGSGSASFSALEQQK